MDDNISYENIKPQRLEYEDLLMFQLDRIGQAATFDPEGSGQMGKITADNRFLFSVLAMDSFVLPKGREDVAYMSKREELYKEIGDILSGTNKNGFFVANKLLSEIIKLLADKHLLFKEKVEEYI